MAGAFWMTAGVTAAALLTLLTVTFLIGTLTGRHSVMDVAWGAGIMVAGVAGFLASAGHGAAARRYLLVAAAVLWGYRLALHVAVRARGADEDPRYRDLLARASGDRNVYALRTVYLPQLLILWVACLPVQAGMVQPSPVSAITAAGCVGWLIGFLFEAVGDWQLTRFRADPANRGRIMDRGLWRYTRHPNYFGDMCMWWGMFAISYGSAVQLLTVVSPLLMTFILTRGTGQRLTDRRMARTRPDYAEYAARTSGFIPLPPRRRRSVLPDGYRDRGLHARLARARQSRAGGGVRRRPPGRARFRRRSGAGRAAEPRPLPRAVRRLTPRATARARRRSRDQAR
jgi:steroid 5-alpha reductase family enzyme